MYLWNPKNHRHLTTTRTKEDDMMTTSRKCQKDIGRYTSVQTLPLLKISQVSPSHKISKLRYRIVRQICAEAIILYDTKSFHIPEKSYHESEKCDTKILICFGTNYTRMKFSARSYEMFEPYLSATQPSQSKDIVGFSFSSEKITMIFFFFCKISNTHHKSKRG